jgi:hypothetical protein
MGHALALDLTKDEQEYGFSVAEEPSGSRAVVLQLEDGLLAVKVRTNDGGSEYAICDNEFSALYTPARSIDELRARFMRHGSGA